MVLGALVVSLYLPESHSLKDKRRIVKSLIDRVRRKFNASVAEVDCLDLWQRTELAIAVVGKEPSHVSCVLQSISAFIEQDDSIEVTEVHTELH